MNIHYRKTEYKDLNQIFCLFELIFKKKISKKYYLDRYYIKNSFNSFVATKGFKIIGHVGFIKHYINLKKNYIYSRHSSFVSKNMRKKNIYTNLCQYSYNKLNNSNNLMGILVFPNQQNYIATNKKFSVKYLDSKVSYYYPNIQYHSKKKHMILDSKIINKFVKLNTKDDFFYKKLLFFKFNYLNQNETFYFFQNDNDIIIYNIKKNKDKKHFYILDSTCSGYSYYKIIKDFIENSLENNTKIYLWFNYQDKKYIKNFKSFGFIKSSKIFNIGVIVLNNKIFRIYDKSKYKSFLMGDTDVFHNID